MHFLLRPRAGPFTLLKLFCKTLLIHPAALRRRYLGVLIDGLSRRCRLPRLRLIPFLNPLLPLHTILYMPSVTYLIVCADLGIFPVRPTTRPLSHAWPLLRPSSQ